MKIMNHKHGSVTNPVSVFREVSTSPQISRGFPIWRKDQREMKVTSPASVSLASVRWMNTQSDPLTASENQRRAKAAQSQQQLGVELFLLRTAKEGRLVSDDEPERTKGERSAREGALLYQWL